MAKVTKVESAITQEDTKEIQALVKEVKSVLAIRTDDDVEKAGVALIQVKKKFDAIEAKRKEYVGPANETVKRINADFKGTLSTLEAYMNTLKDTIITYVRDRKIEIKAQEKELQHEMKDRSLVVTNGIDRIFTAIGEIRFRKEYEFKITNKKLIPEKYWVLDEKMIAKDISDAKGDIKIPGIKVDIVDIGGVAVYSDKN